MVGGATPLMTAIARSKPFHADAFVLFGATGDLAYKMIAPQASR
jgi:hypothetical protein